MERIVWFDARDILPDDTALLSLLCNSYVDVMVVKACHKREYKLPAKMKLTVEVNDIEELQSIDKGNVVMSSDEEVLKAAADKGYGTCIYCTVNDGISMENSWKAARKYDFAVAEFESETNIPLELLIARLQDTGTSLLKRVNSAKKAEIALGVMEKGCDGVLFSSKNMEEVVAIKKVIQRMQTGKMKLVAGHVKMIEHIGMGYRACIDTTSLLEPNEGMIIGSTSYGGILVSSETHYLPYMNLRPFRVNAGAVHSYVWCPEGETSYLTDLRAGSKVLAVDSEGNTREVSVGRIKIEARPLLKVLVEADGKEINAILQDDWHIRVIGIQGEPLNATELSKGTILASYVCDPGRHVGLKIDEHLIEK